MSEEQKAVQPAEKSIMDSVLERIEGLTTQGDMVFPPNYSPGNAVRSAWLILQDTQNNDKKPVLTACTKASIMNALFSMVTKGLSAAKSQGYFIAYGNKLVFQESYLGTLAIAKRDAGVIHAVANIIYEADEFSFEVDTNSGRKKITKHLTQFENIDDNKMKGAYAVITFEDGTVETEVMTMDQIRRSWAQGQARGNSDAHKNFPGEMAKKTVLGRAVKVATGSSDDSALMLPQPEPAYREKAAVGTGRATLDFDEAEVVEETPAKSSTPILDKEIPLDKIEIRTPAETAPEPATNGSARKPNF